MALELPRRSFLHPLTLPSCGQCHPSPNRKLTGMAFHVPFPNVPIVDMTCCLEKAAKDEDIKVVKQASEGPLIKGILGTLRARLSPLSAMTLIVIPTLPPLWLGLVKP